MDITITFPIPPDVLRPNGSHGGFHKLAGARQRARRMACILCNAEKRTLNVANFTPRTYTVTWYSHLGPEPDDDNILASVKSYKDGMADALGINDRALELVRIIRKRDKEARVQLTISDDTWPQAAFRLVKAAFDSIGEGGAAC